MTFESRRFSRRFMLKALTALAGAGAAPAALWAGRARAGMPLLSPTLGRGRSIGIVGAGVAGLTAGMVLARAGFKVTIYEADNRYGGRSLTVRPERQAYRDWWFGQYNPQGLFPEMYVYQYQEDPARSPAPELQVCKFDDPLWDPGGNAGPVELFLNAGPGRIPSDHVALIDLCRQIGVAMEPYIFLSTSNLLQSGNFNGGLPIPFKQVNYSLFGQIAEMLAAVIREGHALGQYSKSYRDKMLQMLQQFGDLDANYRYQGTTRLGYSHIPGGWRDPGVINPVVPLQQTLDSGFVGGGNPETSPGSFLFNSSNIDWQTSLMQPVGGMDRIWQRLLVQEVPADALEIAGGDPRQDGLARRDNGPLRGKRYVGDLVTLNTRTTGIFDLPSEGKVRMELERGAARSTVRHDFCVSTMAPNLLAKIPTSLPEWMRVALGDVDQTPAIKVGWQGKTRFWETANEIYGGISWTDDIIGQIWYPSEDFTRHTGVLTGAYNRGPLASVFGSYGQSQRLQTALNGGEKLHAGFSDKVYADKGMTIAWHYMPNQVGGWPSLTASTQPEVYRKITTLPQGRIYLAGDAWSYLPGWQEGSVSSVYAAVEALAYGLNVDTVRR